MIFIVHDYYLYFVIYKLIDETQVTVHLVKKSS